MLEPILGISVGKTSLEKRSDAVLDGPFDAEDDASALRDGRMSDVI